MRVVATSCRTVRESRLFAYHSNGRLVITSRMGGDKEADDRPCRGEWHRKTIVEIANGSAFRMGDLGIRRGLQSGLDCGEIKPAILLAPSNHPHWLERISFTGAVFPYKPSTRTMT